MFWFWIVKFIKFFVYLFKIPDPLLVSKIDPNKKCPVCGHRKGTLKAVKAKKGNDPNYVFCLHTCQVCGARFFSDPIMKNESVISAATKDLDNAFLASSITSKGESIEKLKDGKG